MVELDEISKRAIENSRLDMAESIKRDVEMFRKLKMTEDDPDGKQTGIPMGTSHSPRIPADADLIWTRQKPATPGWYAWRVGGKVYPYLTKIYRDGETLMADMRDGSWNADHELADVSDREWFGPLPD